VLTSLRTRARTKVPASLESQRFILHAVSRKHHVTETQKPIRGGSLLASYHSSNHGLKIDLNVFPRSYPFPLDFRIRFIINKSI